MTLRSSNSVPSRRRWRSQVAKYVAICAVGALAAAGVGGFYEIPWYAKWSGGGYSLVGGFQAGAPNPKVTCDGDANGDGRVNGIDLSMVLVDWGECDFCANCPGDLNNDCLLDGQDLGIVLSAWGDCPGP